MLKALFAYLIPDVPYRVRLAKQREEYAAKIALEEALYGTGVFISRVVALADNYFLLIYVGPNQAGDPSNVTAI